MSTFYLIWQDPETRSWFPVGRLDRVRHHYLFGYTRGAQTSPRFLPFGNLTDLSAIYVSSELFPIFANRVLSSKRPEFRTYADWSGLDLASPPDPLLLMARMGGARATDTLQVYSVPERTPEGYYSTVFFAHGIRHLSPDVQKRSLELRPLEALYAMWDIQNHFDPEAVALRTGDPSTFIGYCPRHLAPDVRALTRDRPDALKIRVKRVNIDAPPQFRVLCEAVGIWPASFRPCSGSEYQTIADYEPHRLMDSIAIGPER